MTQYVIDFTAARLRRETGMDSSAAHAESLFPGWVGRAVNHLRDYVCAFSAPFTIEEFRAWAYERGLSKPADERAFGHVTKAALKAGLIVRVGYAPTSSSNGSPKPMYARPSLTIPSAA